MLLVRARVMFVGWTHACRVRCYVATVTVEAESREGGKGVHESVATLVVLQNKYVES